MHRYKSELPKRRRTIDGILSSGPRRPRPSALNSDFHARQPALDDFKKPDGFRGRANPRLNSAGAFTVSPNMASTGALGRKDSAKHLNGKKNENRKVFNWRMLKKSALLLAVSVLLISGFVLGKAWWSAHKVFKGGGSALAFDANIDPYLLNGEGDGRVNILLLGKGGDTQSSGPDLTDSMMIASLDPINYKVTLLSIPRDLWVQPDGFGHMKINSVYANAKYSALDKNYKDKSGAESAGITAVTKVVEEYLGVNVNYYGLIDFSAFQEAVDTIGGIDVTLSEPYTDYSMLVGSKIFSLPAGTSHLDGGHALAYARSRMGATRGDFDRGEHQQQVLVGIKNKVLSIGTYSNPIKVTQLLNTFGSRVRTNLSINDLMRVYSLSKKISNNNINHVDLAQSNNAVVRTGAAGDQSVVMPIAGIDNYDAVRAFVRVQLKDGYLAKENASVIVLNGSNVAGAAQKRADELKGWGYNVTQVGDAPNKNATSTMVVDKTKGAKKYTKRYLEQRFKTTTVNSVSGMDLSKYLADFIIIIGPEG